MHRHLLIADDNEKISRLVAGVAMRHGWTCSVHGSGNDLLSAVGDLTQRALIFLDILMPEMDGIEVVKELAKLPIRNDLRIRFLTGAAPHSVAAAKMIAEARSLDIGETIYKPTTTREIEAILTLEADLIDDRARKAP